MQLLHGIRGPLRLSLATVFVVLSTDDPGLAQAPDRATSALPPGRALDGPLTPEKAPRSFQLETGLRVELVAAEPLIASPVAVAFDERGRLFVAENRGYPTGPGPGEPPVGGIAMLEDSDDDG